jgi:hypothetical protein
VPSSSKMVFTKAFAFNVLGLGVAHVVIGPLFFPVVNDHAMLIDAKDAAPSLAVEKNDAIDNFVSVTPIPAVVSVEGKTGRPPSALETDQVAEIQFSFNGETFVFPTGVGDEREIRCAGRCCGRPDA